MIILLAACEQDNTLKESNDNGITGQAIAAEIMRACKYPNGEFCEERCCQAEEKCEDGSFAFMKCDLKAGEWVNKTYADSKCASECKIAKLEETEDEKLKENKARKSCMEGWKCLNKFDRIYRNADCSFGETERCSTGCVNDTCAKLCAQDSFSCKNDILRKCDEDGNNWMYFMACDYGCANGQCLNSALQENQTATNQTQNATQPQNICNSACISIADFHYDASGNDCTNLNDEYVTFKNNCAFSCDLSSWTINDASIHTYTFQSFALGSGNSFTLYTGSGTSTAAKLYWDSRYTPCKAIWNNDGDTIYLRNSNNELILNYTYS